MFKTKSLHDLSKEDYNKWRDELIAAGKIDKYISWELQNVMYKNQLYIAKYGLEEFNNKNFYERERQVLQESIAEASQSIKNLYYDKEDKGTLITEEAYKSLPGFGYLSEAEVKKKKDAILDTYEKLKNTAENLSDIQYDNPFNPSGGMVSSHVSRQSAILNYEELKTRSLTNLEESLEAALHRAEEYDTEVLLKDPIIQNLKKVAEDELLELGNENAAKVLEDFFKLTYWYEAYNGESELENFSFSDKVEIYTDWSALMYCAELCGEGTKASEKFLKKAYTIVNYKLQNEIHTNKTFLDRACTNVKAIATKGLASLGNTILGTYAMFLDDEDLINFVKGLDKDGNVLPFYLNLNYYSSVDKYNVFTTNAIDLANLNGGISASTHVRKYGEEDKFFALETFGEGFSMFGYSLASLAIDFALTRGAGAVVKNSLKTTLKSTTKPFIKKLVTKSINSNVLRTAFDVSRVSLHSLGEGVMEGKNNFDLVYQQAMAGVDEYLQSAEGTTHIAEIAKQRTDAFVASNPDLRSSYHTIYADMYKLVRNEIRLKYEEEASESALQAFNTTTWSFMAKNAATDLLFLSFTFSGRTPFSRGRNGNIKFKNGKATSEGLDAWKITKAVTKSLIGNFIEEATDEMVNMGAQQIGLTQTNNYLLLLYLGKAEPYVENSIIQDINTFKKGAIGALGEKSTWHQAFTGLISPFVSFVPNVSGVNSYARMSLKQKNNLSFVEKLNHFIFNPMIANLASEYNDVRNAKNFVKFYNDAAAKYADNLKNVPSSFDLVHSLNNGKLTFSVKTQKDNEHKIGFDFVLTLYEMAEQGDPENVASQYLETLKRMSKGDITLLEIAEFLLHNGNKHKYDLNTDKEAITSTIKNNAKKLYELFESYSAEKNKFNKIFGDTISPEAMELFVYMSVLTPYLLKRIERIQNDLGGIKTSKRIVRGQQSKAGLQRELLLLKKNIDVVTKILNKSNSKNSKSKVIKKLLKDLYKLEDSLKAAIENEELSPVLSYIDILNASADLRYEMLTHKYNYTLEQIEEIEEAEGFLKLLDYDWAEKIKDIALLEKEIKMNDEALKALEDNPQELEDYIQYLELSYYNNVLQSYTNFYANKLDTELKLHKVGSKEWHTAINLYSKNVISTLKLWYILDGKMNKTLKKAINKAEKLANLVSTITDIIKSSLLPMLKKINLINNIKDIIQHAPSFSQALKLLQEAADNFDIAEDLREYIKTILEKIKAVEKQKRATKKKDANQETEIVDELEIPLNDDSPKDSQEFVLTKTEDIDLEEQGSVEEELPENNQESELTSVDLENFTLFGNSMLGYMLDKLREGILNFTRGKIENDFKSTYFKWLESINVFPQRVVDYELSALKALNVPVLTVLLKLPKEGVNSPMNEVALKTVLLVVKADDRVKKVHNNALSDYIIIKGELYLVLGNLGYKSGASTQRTIFRKLQKNAKIARKKYFDNEENATEEFFLIPDYTLSIGSITSGHPIHQTENDTLKKQRSISELLSDPQRNPRQIDWNDLIWIIPTETGFKANKNVVIAEEKMPERVGHLFLAIKDPRGKYIPVLMKSYVSEDIKDGVFKNKILLQINNILDGVANRDHDKRLTAVKELSKYLLFSENGDNILIGTNQNHTISIEVDGVQYNFTEQDVANNRLQVIDRILGNKNKGIPGKFRIVYTGSTINSIDKMKELDEAGVLTTDTAVLGTAGGQFSVVNGTPTQEEATTKNQLTPNNKTKYNKKESVLLNGKIFRFVDGRYVDENGQTILDLDILNKISIINQCEQMDVSLSDRGSSYYVLNSDTNNLKVVAISGKSNNLRICSQQESLAVIHKIEEKSMLDAIADSAENIELDIESESKNEQLSNSRLLEKIEKNKEPIKKLDVFDKNFGKSLQDSKNNYTFAEISRNPEHRSKIYTLLKDKFGEEYTKAADKEAFLRSKGITTTSIQDVKAWMEHIKNCK